jgi:hypothetical protein
MMDFKKIAIKLSKEEDLKGDLKINPKWPKVRSLFQTRIKNTFKDLAEAIRNEDSKMTQYHFERILWEMFLLSKALRAKELTNQLKNTLNRVLK